MDNGFLASEDLSKKTYERMIENYDYCYVYELGGSIVGFLIASSSNLMDKTSEIYPSLFKINPLNTFIYIFQVGIDINFQRTGIGTLLYNRLFDDVKNKKLLVISSKNPFNKASRNFHLKLGFKDKGIFKWSDGVESYIYSLGFKNIVYS